MSCHDRVLALLLAVALMTGCKSAHRVRDPEFAQVTHAAYLSRQQPTPVENNVNPVVADLAGRHSLDHYISFALTQNPSIQAARKMVEAAAMRVPQAASLKDPMLDVTSWPFYPNTPQTASGRMTADVMVSQEVPWFGKLQNRSEAAEAEVNAARAQLAAAELKTIEEVKLAYYELHLVQQTKRILEQDRRLLADTVEIAESLYRTGKTGQQDILRLQAELANLDSELIRIRQQYDASQAELASVLHVSPETQLATADDLPTEELAHDLERLYAQAIAARPELHAMLADIERGRRNVELAHLEYRPDVTFKFGWGDMTTNRAIAPTADGIDNVAAGLSLNIPIYRKRLDAGVREAEAQVVASARQYDQLKDETQRDVKKLFSQAASQRDMANLFRESIIPKTEQAFQISIREYQVGQAEFADMLGNWRELLRFHITSLQLETQLRQSLASLERTVGGFPLDQATPNSNHDPEFAPQPRPLDNGDMP